MKEINLPRLRFAHLPTPIEPLPRLSVELGGPRLWIKRDDQTGLAFGGNKTRKLEFLLAEAEAHGAKTLVTIGAPQSNHCRQTAAAAARFGLGCILVLKGHPPKHYTGNNLIDALLGAELVWTGEEESQQALERAFQEAWDGGRRPYLIPYGGSNATGASAYVAAMSEYLEQEVPVDRILLATSSGGTQAGLLVGARSGFGGRISGISVDLPAGQLRQDIAALANETAQLLGLDASFEPSEIEVDDSYVGAGYAVVGELEREAIRSFARLEGMMLDPVYTGRAAGGMMDLIRRGIIGADERVLFWHTGGTPALFSFDLGVSPV
jgi:D-cysteine desulfhydrase family pyridoxal phosphate-dependent enzyme